MDISVIIPAYNEEEVIARTIQQVGGDAEEGSVREVIVVDGGSTDRTREKAEQAGATVILSPKKGRAAQMNFGARRAQAPVLYFLHADTLPPPGFGSQIISTIQKGPPAGCFRLSFDSNHPLLKAYAWFSRFDIDAFRFGDQSLFITKELFNHINGFREELVVMEDNEIIKRVKKKNSFAIIPRVVTTSSRKYEKNGVLRLQLIFSLIFFLYKAGYSQEDLLTIYQKFIQS